MSENQPKTGVTRWPLYCVVTGVALVLSCIAAAAYLCVSWMTVSADEVVPLPPPLVNMTGDWGADLCNGYLLVRSSMNDIRLLRKSNGDHEEIAIQPKVVEVGCDERFIVAKRFETHFRSPYDPDATGIPDKNKVSYYIVDTKKHSVHGPLPEVEFMAKKKELKVPAKTVLESLDKLEKKP